MEDEIKKKKYSMVIRHVEFNEDEVDVALELVKEKRLAGIIFLGGYFPTPRRSCISCVSPSSSPP